MYIETEVFIHPDNISTTHFGTWLSSIAETHELSYNDRVFPIHYKANPCCRKHGSKLCDRSRVMPLDAVQVSA